MNNIEEMTLRDYFAGQAILRIFTDEPHIEDYEWAAKQAYKMADAMLKAREVINE